MNARAPNGDTPLHRAASVWNHNYLDTNRSPEVVRLLLDYEADVWARGYMKRRVVDYCCGEIGQILQAAKGNYAGRMEPAE